jgi:hypothetical protein
VNDDLRKAFENWGEFDNLMDGLDAEHDFGACPIILDEEETQDIFCILCKTVRVHMDRPLSDREVEALAGLISLLQVANSPMLMLTMLCSPEEILTMFHMAYLLGKHYGPKLEED